MLSSIYLKKKAFINNSVSLVTSVLTTILISWKAFLWCKYRRLKNHTATWLEKSETRQDFHAGLPALIKLKNRVVSCKLTCIWQLYFWVKDCGDPNTLVPNSAFAVHKRTKKKLFFSNVVSLLQITSELLVCYAWHVWGFYTSITFGRLFFSFLFLGWIWEELLPCKAK